MKTTSLLGRVAVVAGLACGSTGCATVYNEGHFGVLSTKVPKNAPKGKRVSGSACTNIVFNEQTDPGFWNRAVDDALKKAGPDYDTLTDAQFSPGGFSISIEGIWRHVCVSVTGTAIASGKPDPGPVVDELSKSRARKDELEDEEAGLGTHLKRAFVPGQPMHPEVADNFWKAALVGFFALPFGGQIWAPRLFYGVPEGESVTSAMVLGALSLLSPCVHVACLVLLSPTLLLYGTGIVLIAVSQLVLCMFDWQIQNTLFARSIASTYSTAYRRADRAKAAPLVPTPADTKDAPAPAPAEPAPAQPAPAPSPADGTTAK